MPRFSIIIPIYRRHEYVSGVVSSLLAQTFQDWEAVFVDDGSKVAELTEALAAAVATDARIRAVVLESNQGVSGARNRGLMECEGEYVAFLDSDDLYLSWTLQVFNEVLCKEGNPPMAAGCAVLLDQEMGDQGVSCGGISHYTHADYFQYRASVKDWWFSPSGVVVRSDILKSVNGFWSGRDLCEDIDLWHRLGVGHELIRITSPPTYAYRLHEGGIHLRYNEMYDGIARIIEFEKQGGYPGGDDRRSQRISVIAQHARHQALEFANQCPELGWKLYFTTLLWNLRLFRWNFLMAFPVLLALKGFRRNKAS